KIIAGIEIIVMIKHKPRTAVYSLHEKRVFVSALSRSCCHKYTVFSFQKWLGAKAKNISE
ncbi:MAG TPA: hypothetical protein VE954_33240, partial [Oligoflexus sp.]|uniref:hypothetical protein n=1 Tax=Oligoflexus sp. TaxID=1971216 RepID=UPI002D648E4D